MRRFFCYLRRGCSGNGLRRWRSPIKSDGGVCRMKHRRSGEAKRVHDLVGDALRKWADGENAKAGETVVTIEENVKIPIRNPRAEAAPERKAPSPDVPREVK